MTDAHDRRMRLGAVPFIVTIAMALVFPMSFVVWGSFIAADEWSLDNYREIFGNVFYRGAFRTSIGLSALTAAIGLVLGLVVAAHLKRVSGGLRRLVLTYSNIAANFVGVPLAFAFIIMFGFNGAFTLILKRYGLVDEINVYSFGGLILVYSYFQVSLAALLLYPALAAITTDLEEAARLMGVSRARFWRRVGLPIIRNPLIAVYCLLFANAMGTYATVYALVGGSANLVTVRIGELVGGDVFSDPNLANALSTLLVVVLLIPVIVGQILTRKGPAHG
ncbi:MAG TPA: ABC transporter permease subunit [Microvirga sp.]|jgi:putative spermidine/putrescine transport system permease protein|nr:ABC transporter permease subunit [Microvirga sp.]